MNTRTKKQTTIQQAISTFIASIPRTLTKPWESETLGAQWNHLRVQLDDARTPFQSRQEMVQGLNAELRRQTAYLPTWGGNRCAAFLALATRMRNRKRPDHIQTHFGPGEKSPARKKLEAQITHALIAEARIAQSEGFDLQPEDLGPALFECRLQYEEENPGINYVNYTNTFRAALDSVTELSGFPPAVREAIRTAYMSHTRNRSKAHSPMPASRITAYKEKQCAQCGDFLDPIADKHFGYHKGSGQPLLYCGPCLAKIETGIKRPRRQATAGITTGSLLISLGTLAIILLLMFVIA